MAYALQPAVFYVAQKRARIVHAGNAAPHRRAFPYPDRKRELFPFISTRRDRTYRFTVYLSVYIVTIDRTVATRQLRMKLASNTVIYYTLMVQTSTLHPARFISVIALVLLMLLSSVLGLLLLLLLLLLASLHHSFQRERSQLGLACCTWHCA